MSILNGYISKNNIILFTDTLNTKRDPAGAIVPVNFQSKVFVLPHLNSCLCVQAGSLDLGLLLFNYLQKHIIGDEIHTVIQQLKSAQVYGDLPHEMFLPQNNGRILLFGMCYVQDILESYSITFTEGNMSIDQVYDCSNNEAYIITQPEVDTSYYDWSNIDELINSFVEMIKVQKSVDGILPVNSQAGLGGSIQVINVSLCERKVSYSISKLLDFDDKTDQHVSMWKNWKK